MDVYNWGTFLIIVGFTVVIFLFSCKKEDIGTKLLFGFMLLTTFVYSGAGIANDSVPNRYIASYVLLCFGLCIAVKFMFHTRFVLGRLNSNVDKTSNNGFDFD